MGMVKARNRIEGRGMGKLNEKIEFLKEIDGVLMYLIKQKELTKSAHSPEKINVELFARFETRFLYQ